METELRKILDTLYEAQALVEMALRNTDPKKTATKMRLVADKCAALAEMSKDWIIPEEEVAEVSHLTYSEPKELTEAAAEEQCESTDDTPCIESKEEKQEQVIEDEPKVESEEVDEKVNEEKAEIDYQAKTIQQPRSFKPILSFFTINDRFRFRMSLFGNDNRRFTDALAAIEALDNITDAEAMLSKEFTLDQESQEAALFIECLARYFKNR